MAADRERKVKLDRSLNDDCRAFHHGECGHIGSGGSLRTSYVVACSCECHGACPALDAPIDAMDEACTCYETRKAREALAQRLGIKYRKRWEIRRGSAESPDGESVISISVLIALAVMLVVFVGSIIIASRDGGVVETIAIIVAIVTGLYLAWTAVLLVFMRFIIAIIKRVSRKVRTERADNTDEN